MRHYFYQPLFSTAPLLPLDEDSFSAFQHTIDSGVMQACLVQGVPLALCLENGRRV